jgi:hypothetical protein
MSVGWVGCKTIKVDLAGLPVLVLTDILIAKTARVHKASNVTPSVININIVDVE